MRDTVMEVDNLGEKGREMEGEIRTEAKRLGGKERGSE